MSNKTELKKVLENLYCNEKLSTREIAIRIDRTQNFVWYNMIKLNISRRSQKEAQIGKKHTEEHKRKIGKSLKKTYDEGIRNPYWKGKHRSEETKKKMSLKRLGKKHSGESKRRMSIAKGGIEITKEELSYLYNNRKLTSRQIAERYNTTHNNILNYMKRDGIIRRTTSEFKMGQKHSEESKNKIRKNLKKQFDERKLIPYFKGKKMSEEHIKKLSESHKGQISSMKGKHHTEYTRKKMSLARKGKKLSEETRKKMRESWNYFGRREMARERRKKYIFPKFKTKPELNFIKLIEKYNLFYKFTGDGSFWIGNVNPDFVNCNGKKICVEIWGDYWHNREDMKKKDEKRLKEIKKYGWKRIEIWEHEINNPKNELIILNRLGV